MTSGFVNPDAIVLKRGPRLASEPHESTAFSASLTRGVSRFPAAAERLAQSDEIRGGGRLALFEVALAVEQLLLHVEHVDIVNRPGLVALLRDRQCALVQRNHLRQPIAAPLLGIVDNKCIVHLAPGVEYRVFVDDRGLLLLRLAQVQCPLEASAFEDRHGNGRSDNKLSRRPVRETRELKRLETRAAVQRNARIKSAFAMPIDAVAACNC